MRKVLVILLMLVPALMRGQEWVTTRADSLLAEKVLAGLKEWTAADNGLSGRRNKPSVGELMVLAGKAMVGQPYVAGTLDGMEGSGTAAGKGYTERLRIYLTRTDCVVFVETCLALARTALEDGDFRMFADEIRRSRYRGGRIGSYADRLHYTTEWGMQGEERGVLEDVTEELGGVPREHPVHYMSAHPGSYPLMDDIGAIRRAEDRINSHTRYYIPKNKLGKAIEGIRSGDIICLVTNVGGLDISHVMMAAVEDDGTVRPLHASTGPMKVVLDTRTLMEYLAAQSSVAGIQILRPI